MSKKALAIRERAESIERLREIFPKGSRVHTICRHVSQSGMSRDISVIKCGGVWQLSPSYLVSQAVEMPFKVSNGHNAVRVRGAGMDMGFHLVYNLSQVLYGDGYALKHSWL
tara:strand:- start:30 stop:365 length:336 start_codon:yes stop_codon:yes gene_type:complete